MRRFTTVSVIILALLLTACPAVDWKELRFTRHKPAEGDLVGVWRATPETVKYLRARGHFPAASPELVLHADHTFSMHNMPDWWLSNIPLSYRQLGSGEGTWELQPDKNVWQIWTVWLRFPSFTIPVNLYRQGTPYLIFVRVGDPNNGDAMFFERTPKA